MLTKNKTLAVISALMLSTVSLASAATGDIMTTDTMNASGTTTAMPATTMNASGTTATTFKIDKVDASVAKTITATFSKEVSKDGALIKVMEDNRISSSIPDTTDTKKVTLVLNDDVQTGSIYSLFLVSGQEGSMDFTIADTLPTDSITNTETTGTQNIASIKIVDSKTLEVTFKADAAGESEFKLLKEVKVASTDINGNTVTMNTENDLSTAKAYTLTIVTLNDSTGNPISADDSLYDFNYTGTDSTDTASGTTDLNAATGATASGVEATAAQATQLPGTGPKETMLFFAAMLLALFTVLYYRKKIAR